MKMAKRLALYTIIFTVFHSTRYFRNLASSCLVYLDIYPGHLVPVTQS